MEVGERLDECQSDACSGGLMRALGLIIALEDMRQGVGGDAIACVGHADDDAFVAVGTHFHVDVSLLGVLDCVREEVVEHGSDDLRVEVNKWQVFVHLARERHLRVVVQFPVVAAKLADERADVSLCHRELCFALLYLPELQQLVDERLQLVGVSDDAGNALSVHGRQAVVVSEVGKRSRDQRQRRAQFVCEIGEELHALLVQHLSLHVLTSLHFEGISPVQPALVVQQHGGDARDKRDGIDDVGPPRAPEGRCYVDVHGSLCCIGPVLIAEPCPQNEGVVARVQRPEHHIVVVAYLVPFAVHALHHVAVFHVFCLCKVPDGEHYVDGVLPV